MGRIIIVASNCSKDSLQYVREIAGRDPNIVLLEEEERYGKADAVNKILKLCREEFAVFVNSDALPDEGVIEKLLDILRRDSLAGVVSAQPYFIPEHQRFFDLVSKVEHLMWSIHNQCALLLNRMGVSNHSCDELMVVRRQAVECLPIGLVNDGAYIASRLQDKGYSVRLCEGAKVRIDVPRRITELIEQRRRIIFGHLQVRRLTGRAPKTAESMLLIAPRLGVWIPIKTLAENSGLILTLPIAVVGESISIILALFDFTRSSLATTRMHSVWKRYGD